MSITSQYFSLGLQERTSNTEILVQILLNMKNARRLPGKIASTDAAQINPGPIVPDNPDCLPILENPVFHELPRSRQPESPEEETFRSWLKTNTPAHKASPALLERIKRITHDDESA